MTGMYLIFDNSNYIDLERGFIYDNKSIKRFSEKKTLQCLQFFCKNPDCLLRYDRIFDAVWGYNSSINDNKKALSNTIYKLRRQLQLIDRTIDAKKIIENIPSQSSYKFNLNDIILTDQLETKLNDIDVRINYLFFEKNDEEKIPALIEIRNNRESALKDIVIEIKHGMKSILKDRIDCIFPNETFQYCFGYINDCILTFINEEYTMLSSITNENLYEINILPYNYIVVHINVELSKKDDFYLEEVAKVALELSRAGNNEYARILRENILKERRKCHAQDSDAVLIAEANLATTYHRMKRYKEALQLRENVYKIRLKKFSINNPLVVKTKSLLEKTKKEYLLQLEKQENN